LSEFIFTTVPDFDLAGAVRTFGDVTFKIYVTHWMIIYLNGQSANTGLGSRAFWHGPTLEYPFHFQSKIIVQTGCVVFLDYKSTHFECGLVFLISGDSLSCGGKSEVGY
jgi:hypothetical protein